jgi:hypothetical protein
MEKLPIGCDLGYWTQKRGGSRNFTIRTAQHLKVIEVVATAFGLGRPFPDFAALDNKPFLNKRLNHFAEAFVQNAGDIFDGKRMMEEEITNRDIPLGDGIQVRGIGRGRKRSLGNLKPISERIC